MYDLILHVTKSNVLPHYNYFDISITSAAKIRKFIESYNKLNRICQPEFATRLKSGVNYCPKDDDSRTLFKRECGQLLLDVTHLGFGGFILKYVYYLRVVSLYLHCRTFLWDRIVARCFNM